jgi:hypothetical protein
MKAARLTLTRLFLLQRELQRLSETGGASGHQKLRVCETCGAYLSVLDSDRRLADHFGGKVRAFSDGRKQKSNTFPFLINRCIWDTMS